MLQAENEAEVIYIIEIKSKVEALEDQVENGDKSLFAFETQLARERQKFEKELVKEREVAGKLMADLSKSQSNTIFLQCAISNLQCDIKGKDATVTRKDSEIEAKSRALREKDFTISAPSEQLNNARDCLIATKQASMHDPHPWIDS